MSPVSSPLQIFPRGWPTTCTRFHRNDQTTGKIPAPDRISDPILRGGTVRHGSSEKGSKTDRRMEGGGWRVEGEKRKVEGDDDSILISYDRWSKITNLDK